MQVVTSAFRIIPASWKESKKLGRTGRRSTGLQPEHDERRKPATYQRILLNIQDAKVTIHCTITSQTAERPGYLDEFLRFWSARPEIAKVWFSLFTSATGSYRSGKLHACSESFCDRELSLLRRKYAIGICLNLSFERLLLLQRARTSAFLLATTETFPPDS